MSEHFAIRTEDATHEPVIRIRTTVEIGGDWVSPDMIAYAAQQWAHTLAGHLNAAADQREAEAEGEPRQEVAFTCPICGTTSYRKVRVAAAEGEGEGAAPGGGVT